MRQTSLLARHVADGERSIVSAVRVVQRADATAARRAEDEQVGPSFCFTRPLREMSRYWPVPWQYGMHSHGWQMAMRYLVVSGASCWMNLQ